MILVDYADFSGETKSSKARSLITYCERRDMMDELLRVCQKNRPNYEWLELYKSHLETQERSEKLSELRIKLNNHFSRTDLQELCFNLLDPKLYFKVS